MAKEFNQREFKVTYAKEVYRVCCFTTKTSMYHTEHAVLYTKDYGCIGFEGKYKWSNRPWQSFDYCSAMSEMIDKMAKSKKYPKRMITKFHKVLIENQGREIKRKCDKMVQSFKEAYDKTPQSFKDAMAKSNVVMESESDVNAMTALMGLATLLG